MTDTVAERDWTYFGIKTDGTDTTAQLQDALDYFGCRAGYGIGSKTGHLTLPPVGVCGFSSELTYFGDVSHSLVIDCGTAGRVDGQTGCLLKWLGGPGAVGVRMVGANGCIVRNIGLDGANALDFPVAIDNARENGGTFVWGPSANNLLENISVFRHAGVGCACIRIGGVGGTQVSEVHVDLCCLKGRTGTTIAGAGVKVTQAGNCKNIRVTRTEFGNHTEHVAFGGSGSGVVRDCGFGWTNGACVTGGGQVTIQDCQYEGDTGDSVRGLLYDGGPPSDGACGNSLVCIHVKATAPFPGMGTPYPYAGGVTANSDIVIRSPGRTVLECCEFASLSAASTFPKVCVGATHAAGNGGSLVSLGNRYVNAPGPCPIYDSSGNCLTSGWYAATIQASIASLGDMGSAGANPLPMVPMIASPTS